MRRVVNLSLIYLAAYFIASYLDLRTTLLALQRPGTSEGNVYSTSGHDYIPTKAWLITVAGAVFIEAFLLFGALYARRVAIIGCAIRCVRGASSMSCSGRGGSWIVLLCIC